MVLVQSEKYIFVWVFTTLYFKVWSCDTTSTWFFAWFHFQASQPVGLWYCYYGYCLMYITHNFTIIIKTFWIVLFMFCWVRRYWFTICQNYQGRKVFVRSYHQIGIFQGWFNPKIKTSLHIIFMDVLVSIIKFNGLSVWWRMYVST